jgi:hypothetical protein
MSEPKHLTDGERDELFKAFTTALQVGLLPVLGEYEEREDVCIGCGYWQLVRSLAVALIFFAKRIRPKDQTAEDFLVELVTEALGETGEPESVH